MTPDEMRVEALNWTTRQVDMQGQVVDAQRLAMATDELAAVLWKVAAEICERLDSLRVDAG